MSRVSNALQMYMLLQVRNIMKIDEIAEILEVTPRMVNEYKNDLEKAGIYIGSKRGRNGGYYLENTFNLKAISITEEELEALKMASEVIRSGNYTYATEFETLSSKVLNMKKDFEDISYYNKNILKPIEMKEKEKRIWTNVNKAIGGKNKLKIDYSSIDYTGDGPKSKTRIVHPYGVFDYEGSLYLYGYCELRKEIRFFKFLRINRYEILKDKFKINSEYNLKEIINKSFGIFNDEFINLKLKIYYPMSQIVREKQYAMNQKIEEIDNKAIYFEAKLKGYKEIKSWVMSMGSLVEVIEPIKLRDEILKEISKIRKIYE
ncbi:helix-turn-helix transcriptional regulator [Garciella nitratireducens]|uniref:Predicted DNA-binding transcriptional regulator YafY, contains an HTH and WYL domains n=1 Tax=Garciella nitratireducens DSM 15102 TaxID=1121911 RepID=A0A1T4N5I2_9FIRM|nr:WYL domain-containing protein [Garciella nitratireducens]RBP38228.1 putative DNA-binding transcriptional regulator YafY [Garciella nitratireducens]SJZ74492.1 Predicted DNA-binding transcriptional regulator YafY, contains an HTH and WYL domains [Garciella nitratireducens DSM 15102]